MSRFPWRWWEILVMALTSGAISAVIASLWQWQPFERAWESAVTTATGCAMGAIIYGWISQRR